MASTAKTGYIAAADLKKISVVTRYLCDNARPGELGKIVIPAACAECESPCAFGRRYLELMDMRELLRLACGGDCIACDQPCNLRSVMRKRRREYEFG